MATPSAGGARAAGIREKDLVVTAPSASSRAVAYRAVASRDAAVACKTDTGTGEYTGGVGAVRGIKNGPFTAAACAA